MRLSLSPDRSVYSTKLIFFHCRDCRAVEWTFLKSRISYFLLKTSRQNQEIMRNREKGNYQKRPKMIKVFGIFVQWKYLELFDYPRHRIKVSLRIKNNFMQLMVIFRPSGLVQKSPTPMFSNSNSKGYFFRNSPDPRSTTHRWSPHRPLNRRTRTDTRIIITGC